MTDKDEVRLIISGTEFSGWTGATIQMAVDTCADVFSISAPYNPSNSVLRDCLRPFGYQKCKLYVGDDLYLTGTVDKVDATSDSSGRSLTIQGRSLTGSLVDCSIDGPLEFSGLKMSAIAKKVTSLFGLSVVANTDTDAIEVARAEYGQTAFDFLNSVGAPYNLLFSSGWGGELLINSGAALKDCAIVERLKEGEGRVMTVASSFDGTKRYSVYKVASQASGSPDVLGVSKDSTITRYRPRLEASDQTAQDPAVTAARHRARAMVESFGANVTLSGWRRSDGKRWADRQAVTLHAPGVLLTKECKYTVAGLTLKMDNSGRTTDLRLVLPETYSGTMPKETPWA